MFDSNNIHDKPNFWEPMIAGGLIKITIQQNE